MKTKTPIETMPLTTQDLLPGDSLATQAPVAALLHSFTLIKGDEKTVIKLRLDDQCGNGHEDFSLTADIYEKGRTGWRDVGGGCCHDHILKLKPELAPFAALHLSDALGRPMHAAANALYWFAGTQADGCGHEYHGGTGSSGKTPEECARLFREHTRITPEEAEKIAAFKPRTQDEMSFILEELKVPQRWEMEAQAAIRQLEEWTGKTFRSEATRNQWEPLTPEKRDEIRARVASGYYTPEAIAARDAEKAEASRLAAIAEIEKDHTIAVAKLEKKKQVALYFASRGMKRPNVIYYDHTGELEFNWTSTEKLWTREEFDAFTQSAVMSELPPGLKFKFQDRPKY